MASFDDIWKIAETVQYVRSRGFERVALQFPDELLYAAPEVYRVLGRALEGHSAKLFLLADTTFDPYSVDEVAAHHVDAECVIHYGYTSFRQVARLPVFFVLPHQEIEDLNALRQHVQQICRSNGTVVVFLDLSYLHARGWLAQNLQGLPVAIADASTLQLEPRAAATPSCGCQPTTRESNTASQPAAPENAGEVQWRFQTAAGFSWDEPPAASGACGEAGGCLASCLWVGASESRTLTSLAFAMPSRSWCTYNPANATSESSLPTSIQRQQQRRMYLVERARNAAIVGILVGTLSVAGYQEMMEQLQTRINAAGKKTYTFLMGKPNPYKLANFPEVEVWVHIADPHAFVLDCKEYLAPIVSPAEMLVALGDASWDPSADALGWDPINEDRYSQRTEAGDGPDNGAALEQEVPSSTALVHLHTEQRLQARASGAIQPCDAAEYLSACRTFVGLETPATGAEHKEAEHVKPGKYGRAREYEQFSNSGS